MVVEWRGEIGVEEKHRLFKSWKNTKNEEDKKYNGAKYRAKNVIGKVQHEQRLRFIEDLEQENEKGNIFCVPFVYHSYLKDVSFFIFLLQIFYKP